MRRSPAAYSDGVFEMAGQDRPNPFKLSDAAHEGDPGQASSVNRNAMLVFFGKYGDSLRELKAP